MEVLDYLWKSALVLGIFFLVYKIFLQKETLFQSNRHYLILGILTSFLLPFLQFTETVTIEITTPTISTSSMEALNSMGINNESQISIFDQLSIKEYAVLLYILVTFFFLARMAVQLFSLRKLFNLHHPLQRNGYQIIETEKNLAPFSFFKTIMLNPSLHSEKELLMILNHEEVHMKGLHSIDMIITHLLVALQWFNPIAWLYRKATIENLEYIADKYAQSQAPCRKQYQLALVKVSSPLPIPMLVNPFYQSFIKKRIIMLNKNHSNPINVFKAVVVLPLLAFFLYSFNIETVTKYVEVPLPEVYEDSTPITMDNTMNANDSSDNDEDVPNQDGLADLRGTETSDRGANDFSNPETIVDQVLLTREGFKMVINKTTSEAELKKLKEDLKKQYSIDLSYSTQRNGSGEIIGLSMQYSGKDRNGNYQVTDDKGIEEFTFYIDENGKTGFFSEVHERHLEERKAEMEMRKVEMEQRREERQHEMEERNETRQMEMEARRAELAARNEEREHRIHEDQERQRVRLAYVDDSDHNVYEISSGDDHEIAVVSRKAGVVVIDKDTSDQELNEIKSRLLNQGIDFTYKNVKRNSRGEITGLKFNIKDKNGKSSTIIRSDNGNPIERIIIPQ